MIYALLVLGIIILLIFIGRMICKKDDIMEGMIDYYTIENYLESLPLTRGRYILIYGAQQLQISQVQVFDMNGTNIALKRPVQGSTPQRGSGLIDLTIDGNTKPRTGLQNVWTSSREEIGKWILDLGEIYQISSVSFTGMSPTMQIPEGATTAMLERYKENPNMLDPTYISPRGLKVEVWKDWPSSESYGYEQQGTLMNNDLLQVVAFPNSVNLTQSVTYASKGALATGLLPLNSPQPEVYTISGQYSQAAAEIQCNINGAQLANRGQLENASMAGASWTAPGWIKGDAGFLYNPYTKDSPWYNKVPATDRAQPICFGVKPLQEVNAAIQKFNVSTWSQYTTKPVYSGTTSYTMSDIQRIKETVRGLYTSNLTPAVWASERAAQLEMAAYTASVAAATSRATVPKFIRSANDEEMSALFDTLKELSPLNFLLESSLDNLDKISTQFITDIQVFGTLPNNAVNEMNNSISICKRIFLGSPLQIEKFVNIKYAPSANDIKPYIRANPGPIGNVQNPPTFCKPELVQEFSETSLDYTTTLKDVNQTFNNTNCNVELTPTMLGLIPETARKFLIKWIFDRKKRVMRHNYPYLRVVSISADKRILTYKNLNIWKTLSASSYENAGDNRRVSTRPTSSESIILPLGTATPNMVQTLVGMKIYGYDVAESNLTIVSSTGDQANGTITLSGPTDSRLSSGDGVTPILMVSTVNDTELDAVKYITPITSSVEIVTEYNLNMIAQGFYEAMGGNYIMSSIYDVFTVGTTILDMRFDLTKHVDVTEYHRKLVIFKELYYTLRDSNVTQDILDTAKSNYDNAIANMEVANQLNTLPAVTGMVGRFFYTYDNTTAKITITGFTLDARAVTSFMREMNCGMDVPTGSTTGTISFKPTIVYTKNIPEAIDCSNPKTLRRIMEDYIVAASTDLKEVLKAATPPVEVKEGNTLRITEVLGSTQVSPTQCAITWKERLWDDAKNTILKDTTEITRSGLMTYSVNTSDWLATNNTFDISGFKLFANANVPACVFNATDYQERVSPRLDLETDVAKIRADFLVNGFNNGRGEPCYKTLPLYTFNPADYAEAKPAVNTIYKGATGSQGVVEYYRTTGIVSGDSVRLAKPITPLSPPIIIPQPLPAAYALDNASDVCPNTDCEDINVLYSLVDQYNSDPTQPGSIMRITRAFTATPYQCDVEIDINYDVNVLNAAGQNVKKGSYTYDAQNNEVPATVSLTGVKQETRAFFVSVNTTDCTYSLDRADGPGTGATIQANLPQLYKPMEYATQFQETTTETLSKAFKDITDTTSSAATTAASVLSSYRKQGMAAAGNITTLGTCPNAKCSDTENLNAMLAYYSSKTPLHTKQINNIMRVGTLDDKTCDITFQEDTLGPGFLAGSYKIVSSQTAGLRFTMGPGAAPCTFTPTAMTPILPSPPAEDVMNMASIPSSATCSEVYGVSGSFTTPAAAVAKCATYGAVLATTGQLKVAQANGASWTSPGFLADASGVLYDISGSGIVKSSRTSGGAVCFGMKPKEGSATDILPFKATPKTWSVCPTTPYANPRREVLGFTNYVNPERVTQPSTAPIRVTESTFPLNSHGFGLDSARNRDAPPIDTLYKEPLRQMTRPATETGPMVLGSQGDEISPQKPGSYKYLRFKPVKTRDPRNATVEVGKFRFFLGKSEIDMSKVKVTNPMGTWIGDIEDVIGAGYTSGWSDLHKRAIVFAFPHATMVNGFTWTTANPDKGVGGDPVQWKLEGSQNGVYWTILRDQTQHNFPVSMSRFQELPLFRF